MSILSQATVSIIIPIYNRENTIEPCTRSLFEQTLDTIEYIFIDDGSKDLSIEVLKSTVDKYPKRKPWIKIISLPHNEGVAAARRIGIENATGKYIIHCDSDDWVDKDMYERLYLKAKESNADIVGCNFRHEYSDVQYDFHQQYTDNMEENIRRLINGKIFPSLCTSLTLKKLIFDNRLSFPVGLNMGEDLFFNLQLYIHAKKIVGIDWAPYHYQHTEDSSCVQRSKISIESDIAIASLIEKMMKENGLYDKYKEDIEYRKFFSKLPLATDLNNTVQCQEWIDIFPETNKNVWRYQQIDWKQRGLLWLVANNMLPIGRLLQHFIEFQHRLRFP